MTVINRKEQNCEYPNSTNASDTESLHGASGSNSDVESLHNEPTSPYRPVKKLLLIRDSFNQTRTAGKRAQRRAFNKMQLETLAEDDELFIELIEIRPTPLTRLTQDENALNLWYDFNELSEEEQNEFISSSSEGHRAEASNKSDSPLSRICSKIKRALKIKKVLPSDVIYKAEEDVVAFFTKQPSGLLKSCPNSSFERLMVHGIAQYHNLQSISTLVNMVRYVEINNVSQHWEPVEESFLNAIKQLRR